ncbi:hypothetical protein ACWEWG_25870 [Streptomyces sp. NPDC003758]|uniref:hypothetical protein n=1 Tax=Streptomyces cynarae TaxID=2981134 RepID=UPI0028BD497C|nr:hypothetical protein [Streptomyces cynarae]
MRLMAGLRDADRTLSKRTASRIPPRAGTVLSAVEEMAESSKLWCGAAAAMAWLGGWRGRSPALVEITDHWDDLVGAGRRSRLRRDLLPWVSHYYASPTPPAPSSRCRLRR